MLGRTTGVAVVIRQYDAGQEELIRQICHLIDNQMHRVTGHIGQSPCREDFFKIFQEAYKRGYFSPAPAFRADWLRDSIWHRVPHKEWEEDRLEDLINHFGSYWNEWRYAWDRAADLGFTL